MILNKNRTRDNVILLSIIMKRSFDLTASILAFIIFSPVIIVLVFTITVFQGKPVLFKQIRSGKNHKPFKIVKFRTMTVKKDEQGHLLPDKERTTKLGEFLRKTSLDELPGLINVIKGDMSLVGPRPLPTNYKNRYTQDQDRRHEVKPGITGWAQVNGRNAISWEKKFALDVWYVDNQSHRLDMKILILTISRVLLRKDITPIDKESMEEFLGTK